MLVHPWTEVDLPLLKSSLCLAMQGRAFPGQDEYCQSVQQRYRSLYGGRHAVPVRPPSMTPSRIAFDSALAIGLDGGRASTAYLEVALQIEPDSTIAAQQLIDWYRDKQRFDQVQRVALGVARHLPEGDQKENCDKIATAAAKRMGRG